MIGANRVVLSRRAEMRSNVGVMTEKVGSSVFSCHDARKFCEKCASRQSLPELLLADGGDEFLEVERFEVCDVLEIAGA